MRFVLRLLGAILGLGALALVVLLVLPHAMVVQIVASGHMTPMEQPDAVNGAMRAFLGTVGE